MEARDSSPRGPEGHPQGRCPLELGLGVEKHLVGIVTSWQPPGGGGFCLQTRYPWDLLPGLSRTAASAED